MTKLFFILLIAFFIAELIIAVTAIINLYKFDKKVRKWNNLISVKNDSIRYFFIDFRTLLKDFSESIINFRKLIKQKKTLYIYNFLKTVVIYLGIFSLKGKYKKAAIAFQLGKEIYQGISET